MSEQTSSKPACCSAGRNQVETGFVKFGKLEWESGTSDIREGFPADGLTIRMPI